jgi:AcrR family transcriptional regulator
VLAAARELLAQGGSDAVTMRALARRLDVAPNALYSHVESKTTLLDDLLDDVLAGVESPAPDVADPVAGLQALMSSTYDLLNGHPDLVPLYLARQGARGPRAVRLGEIMDTLLARAGVEAAAVPLARRVLIVHTIGFAAFATGPDTAADAPERPISAEQSYDSFHRSLDWLLAGIVGGARRT